MIYELIAIIEKNFRRLVRSRVSALIVLLGPLVLIGVVGFAFSSSGVYGIIIGVHAENYNNATNSFINNLKSKEFSIQKYEFAEDCIESVRSAKSHVCLVFPSNDSGDNRVEFHVDYSRLNIVLTLIDILSAKMSDQSKEISLGLVSELVDKMKYTVATVENNTAIIDQLKSGAIGIGVKIVDVRQEVENLNLSFSLDSMNFSNLKSDVASNQGVISAYEKTIKSQINTNRAKLNQFRDEASDLKDYVDTRKKKKDSIISNIRTAYAKQGCTSQIVVDLTPYLEDADALSEQLSALSNPSCSFLFTTNKTVAETGNQLDSTSRNLNEIINNIDDANEQLDEFESQTQGTFDEVEIGLLNAQQRFDLAQSSVSDAESRIKGLQDSKEGFSSQLEDISLTVNQSILKFDEIGAAMNAMISNINNITVISPETIVTPIATKIKPLTTNKKTLDYLFSSLLVLVVMFVSILLASSLVMREKSSGATFRNLISPVKSYVFVLGTYFTTLIITLIQLMIIIFIATLFFNTNIFPNLGTILTILAMVITIFAGVGIIISNLFRSEETSTIASIIMACIFFFFSNVIVPIEKMSETMAIFAKLNPFVVAELMLNKSFLFNKPLADMGTDLIILIVQMVIISGLAVYSFKAFRYGEETK